MTGIVRMRILTKADSPAIKGRIFEVYTHKPGDRLVEIRYEGDDPSAANRHFDELVDAGWDGDE